MPSQTVFFDLSDTTDERFDPIIEWLLIGLLAFMPFAFGAVHAWSEAIVVAVSAAMSLTLLAKLLVRPDVRFIWTAAYLPMAGFLFLVAQQLLPLPAAIARLLSPQTVAIKTEILSRVPESFRHLDFVTLSFYPEGTRHDFRLIVAVAAVFVVCVNTIRRMEQVRRVLTAVAVIGTLVAALAIIQNALDAKSIYFRIQLYSEKATSGPFVNHSHFGQFTNLSIGAALALLLIHADQLPRNRRLAGSAVAREFTRPVTFPVWALACAIALMAVSIPISLTRGGMISMFIAGSFTAAIMAWRPDLRRRAWGLIALMLVVLIGLLVFRFESVVQRFSTLDNSHTFHGRMQILRDTATAWRALPLFGAGLGTFEQVFPSFDRSSILSLATHAENEYAQLLMETGICGVVLISAFAVVVASAYVRCLRRSPSPMTSTAVGLGYGLLAILVHSATDFGQHIPANACLTAVYCAIILSLAQAARHGQSDDPRVLFRGARLPRVVGGAVIAGVFALILTDAINVWRAESIWKHVARMDDYLRRRIWGGSDDDFYYLIVPAAEAARIRPGNILYQHQLNYYRWRSISRGPTGQPRFDFDDEQKGYVHRIVEELLAAAHQCPTYGQTYWLAGQLQRKVLSHPEGAELVRLGYRLSPTNPHAALDAAEIDAQAGEWEEALSNLRRAITLDGGVRQEAVEILLDLHRADLAVELAGEDVQALEQVAGTLEARRIDPQLSAVARARAAILIEQQASVPDAPAEILIRGARLRVSRGEHSAAAALFRRALQREYSQWQWRLELAQSHAAAGRFDDALREARIVHRGVEGTAQAEKLIAELSLRQAAASAPSTAPSTAPATAPRVLLPRPRQ
jgi:O-antigen ligase/tetratricopeptide (TPR) repeat protein